MRVARAVGLGDGVESLLLRQARDRWAGWVAREPVLALVPGGVAGLQSWTRERAGDYDALDGVLVALAGLARDGGSGEGEAAAATLAWALLGAAERLAWSLRAVSGEVEHLVAAHLWIQCRCVPPARRHKVAANVLYTVRSLVLADCGYGSRAGPDVAPVRAGGSGDVGGGRGPPGRPRGDGAGFGSGGAARGVGRGPPAGGDLGAGGPVVAGVGGRLPDPAGDGDRPERGVTNRAAAGLVARRWGVAEVTIRRRAARAIGSLAGAGSRRRVVAGAGMTSNPGPTQQGGGGGAGGGVAGGLAGVGDRDV